MTTLASSWSQARGAREVRPARPPLLLLFVSWLARHLPAFAKVRTVVMQFAAFGLADYAVWEYVGHGWGFGAIAVSLLVLETLLSADVRGKARR
jgi:hypothetical protein